MSSGGSGDDFERLAHAHQVEFARLKEMIRQTEAWCPSLVSISDGDKDASSSQAAPISLTQPDPDPETEPVIPNTSLPVDSEEDLLDDDLFEENEHMETDINTQDQSVNPQPDNNSEGAFAQTSKDNLTA